MIICKSGVVCIARGGEAVSLRELIGEWQRREGLTLTALSQRLGYGSKTSVQRVMDGQARASSALELEMRLRERIPMSRKEETRLHREVGLLRFGETQWQVFEAFWRLLSAHRLSEGTEAVIRVVNTGETTTLTEHYAEAEGLLACVQGCVTPPYALPLDELAAKPGAVIYHALASGNDRDLINGVSEVLHLVPNGNYHLRMLAAAHEPTCGNMMVCEYTLHGQPMEDLLMMHADGTADLLTRTGGDQLMLKLVGGYSDSYRPFKQPLKETLTPEGYLSYLADFAALEHNRAIWSIRSNIGASLIPGELMIRASEDRLPPELLARAKPIAVQRTQNTYARRQPVCVVFKHSAVERFLDTGCCFGHFSFMRPFTQEERAEIIDLMLQNMRANPYFHVYFLRDDNAVRDIGITAYADRGLILVPAEGESQPMERYYDGRLPSPAISRQFSEFFTRELLPTACCTEHESCVMMENLLRQA